MVTKNNCQENDICSSPLHGYEQGKIKFVKAREEDVEKLGNLDESV